MQKKKFLHKKTLGQHFLRSPHYLAVITDAAELQKGDPVLEIGPGDGVLTAVLLARGARVIAVEKDRRLIPLLAEKFAKEISEKKLILLEADILRLDISSHFAKSKSYKVVANIPYYITGALVRKLLTEKMQPSLLVLLVQREVAERIARDTKESILSLSVKAYGNPAYIKAVPRGAFSPPPNVDSAILKITDVSRKNFADKTLSDKVRPTPQEAAFREKKFFELVKKGFSSKRKLLLNNLGKEHSNILQNVGISAQARAEDVPLEQWLALAKTQK